MLGSWNEEPSNFPKQKRQMVILFFFFHFPDEYFGTFPMCEHGLMQKLTLLPLVTLLLLMTQEGSRISLAIGSAVHTFLAITKK